MATLAEKQSAVEAMVAAFAAAGQSVQAEHAGESGHYRSVPTTDDLAALGVLGLSGPLQHSESLRVDEYGTAVNGNRGWVLSVTVRDDADGKLYDRAWNNGPLDWMAHGWREVVTE